MVVSLRFILDIEDEWPPFGTESLLFEEDSLGYKCCSVSLFVRDLSVNDVIAIEQDKEGAVSSWKHLRKSGNTTIWLLRLRDDPPIEACLSSLRSLQCNTTGIDDVGCYAVDVPPSLPIAAVEGVMDTLDPDLVAIAFPSMRHVE